MEIEKYIITKEKADLLSLVEQVDNNLIQEALEEYGLEILEGFEMFYDMSKIYLPKYNLKDY